MLLWKTMCAKRKSNYYLNIKIIFLLKWNDLKNKYIKRLMERVFYWWNFDIQFTSSGIYKIRLKNLDGEISYITRTDRAKGIDSFIRNQEYKHKTDKSNVITLGLDTQTVFYQKSKFYTGQNIQVLKFPQLNQYNAFFIIPFLKKQMEKFNWAEME